MHVSVHGENIGVLARRKILGWVRKPADDDADSLEASTACYPGGIGSRDRATRFDGLLGRQGEERARNVPQLTAVYSKEAT